MTPAPPATGRSLPHMPQLDGLRALAVFFVMGFHFVPKVDRIAPFASIGVRLFFVLSGFLITSILLASRRWALGDALRVFYGRRFLRIFPLFYFVLLVTACLDVKPVRETLVWHLTYLSNVYFYRRGDWHGSISHLWSLAVEEQFYLVWPVLILGLPRRYLGTVIAAMILVAPLCRLVSGEPLVTVLPFSCLDSLGMGALLACYPGNGWLMGIGFWLGLPLLAVTLLLRYLQTGALYQLVTMDMAISLVGMWLVGRAACGFTGLGGRLLQLKPVVYVGTISYGVYVYHNFMPTLLAGALQQVQFPAFNWLARFLLLSGATLIVASISWRWLEKPINDLKRHFVPGDPVLTPDPRASRPVPSA